MKKTTLWVVLAAMAYQTHAFAADFSSVVEQRQELMKANREAQKALKSAADAGDLAIIEAEANKLAEQFEKIGDPALFPAGSEWRPATLKLLQGSGASRKCQRSACL